MLWKKNPEIERTPSFDHYNRTVINHGTDVLQSQTHNSSSEPESSDAAIHHELSNTSTLMFADLSQSPSLPSQSLGSLIPISNQWNSANNVYSTTCMKDNDTHSAWIAWKDLSVWTASSGPKTHILLDNLSGYAEPNRMLAIMGPSGCGKSTFLDALAGRLPKNLMMSGDVLVNGQHRILSYGTAAFVAQEETLIGTLTAQETIMYSANIRLPDTMPKSEKEEIVQSTLLEMGLQDCADTPVGNWHLRGLSGGEKRRVSIAIEILVRPRLLFLDEPTSGLDSASAFFIMQTLKALSRGGRTVLFSIHQPGCEVFTLFDKLCLLSCGRTIYFGDASQAHEFFAQAGFPCPERRNPSDHFLMCINSEFDRVKHSLQSLHRYKKNPHVDPLDTYSTPEIIDILANAYNNSQHAMDNAAKIFEISQAKDFVLESSGSQASFLTQTKTLTKRSFVNMSRDLGYYWLRLIVYIIVAIGIGTMYLNVGTSYNSILARGSCTSFVSGFVTFMSVGGFPSFVEDMKVFQRERLNGHYGVWSFVIANTLSSFPFLVAIAFSTGTICYYMAGLHPGFKHYIFFTVNLLGCIGVVESLMMAIATVVPDFLMGIIIGSGLLGVFMLVSGFFRLPNDLPKVFWRYPVSYLSFNYWALQGQYKNDYMGLEFDNVSPLFPPITGKEILTEKFQIDLSWNKWWNAAMVFAFFFAYRIIFFMNIKLNEQATPYIRACLTRKTTQQKVQQQPAKSLISAKHLLSN
ncbi:hypothetical protein KP509_19G024200 [Ceratopteris richardii]|uniref:ABC transporter domain-containing protein n=1 Tax=Ceratopteris richardii TaxID=49495 RepID=A0A8T2SMB2_CERRI|nr:hypothetical protein KP509_19G024200 [Ceratopteris richardii]